MQGLVVEQFGHKETRRQVLKWAAVSVAGLATLLSPKNAFAYQPSDVLRHAMLTVFKDQGAARAVGDRYLADHPEDGDTHLLAEALFGQDLTRLSPGFIRKTLNMKRRHDFAADRYVLVDNWVLARSEARACALVSML